VALTTPARSRQPPADACALAGHGWGRRTGLLLRFVVSAFAAGEVAGSADRIPLFNRETARLVNRLGVAASARLFPFIGSGHRRSLSRVETAGGGAHQLE
jgi:hypothetical protein